MGGKRKVTCELTPREIEVLRLIAEGLRNGEIAVKLHIAEHTVKKHISNIFSKLDIDYRAQLIVYAYQNKLIKS